MTVDANDKESFDSFILNRGKDQEEYEGNDKKTGRGNILILTTFILETIILAFVVVLEYFLRWTTVFPIRRQNFSCSDPDISFHSDESAYSNFAFEANVPDAVIYSLSFCVPPFVILVGEIGVWAFTDGRQKTVSVGCSGLRVSQVVRRLVRFIGVFVFGAFTLMIFIDVIKLMTGRLRPTFLEICKVNRTICAAQGGTGNDELCSETDEMLLRFARTSFPSLYSALSGYSAIYLSIYVHGALKTRSVRVLRPFLALAFTILALLCGLMEVGHKISHDNDVIAGFVIGGLIAVYLGAVVLYKFQEHVPEKIVLSLLHRFLLDHQLLEELWKESGQFQLLRNKDIYIPRAYTRRSSRQDDPTDTNQRARMYDNFQRALSKTVDYYRDRRNSQLDPISHL